MPKDVFGDLSEWGEVLTSLQELRANEALEQHQTGLARLIRCKSNWRLREEALISAALIRKPSPALVEAVLKLLTDGDEILENRLLAAHALGSMLASVRSDPASEVCADAIVATLEDLMREPGPPVMHTAVRQARKQATAVL